MPATVPQSDNGTVAAAASIGINRRRNRKTTSSTSATAISSVIWMSSTLARIVVVRSVRTVTLMSGGIQASNCGNNSRTRSAVAMALASEVLEMLNRIAGSLPFQAARRELATPFTTVATSDSRITAPLTDFSTSLPYSGACDICPFRPMLSA